LPVQVLRWWNAADAPYDKAAAALDSLNFWNNDFPATGGFPALAMPLVPAANRWSVVCEAMGGLASFGGAAPAAFATGFGNTWVCVADTAVPPTQWMAVRRAGRPRQLGYLGSPSAPVLPHRYDKTLDGAWPPVPPHDWDNLPDFTDNVLDPARPFRKPRSRQVRGYLPRREIVRQEMGRLRVHWYHAISGGRATTLYDLIDALTLILRHAENDGVPRICVLIGDLNATPQKMRGLLSQHFFHVPILIRSRLTLGSNELGVLATNRVTQTAGATARELDYALIYNYAPAGPVGPVRARIERGYPPINVPPPPTPYRTPIVRFRPPASPPGPPAIFWSDHHPIRVALEY
jgi:hypothetical protein